MARITYNFHSQVLDFHQTVHIIVPEPNVLGILNNGPCTEEMPVLYLLHGLKGAAHVWGNFTSVERYLYESQKKLIIVMPEMHNNFYTDQYIGWPYLTYLAEELPRILQTFLHVSPKREDTYAAGLSMGGYGAVKLALAYPEKFGYAASFSGALDLVDLLDSPANQVEDIMYPLFGPTEGIKGSQNDLFHLLHTVKQENKPLPELYISCGSTDEPLFTSAVKMTKEARELGYKVKFHEERNMGHAWSFWDKEVEKLIRTLILE